MSLVIMIKKFTWAILWLEAEAPTLCEAKDVVREQDAKLSLPCPTKSWPLLDGHVAFLHTHLGSMAFCSAQDLVGPKVGQGPDPCAPSQASPATAVHSLLTSPQTVGSLRVGVAVFFHL
jgi:hypothetical protein